MNKESFISFMQKPESLNKASMDELAYLINEFPYCQSAHILLSLNHFKENSILFESSLKTTAIYAGSRKVLKKHIDRISINSEKVVLPDEAKAEAVKPTPVQEEKTVEVKPDVKSEVKSEEKPKAKPVETKKEKTEVVKEDTIPEPEKPIEFERDEHEVNKKRSIEELKKIVEKRIREIEKEKKAKSEPGAQAQDKPPKKSDLIDKFIREQPVISRPKTEFFDASDHAAASVVDQENIISETLAGIYVDQGLIEKAKNIYKKLSLKYPEKSSYFAALIEKAEKENINKK